MCKCFMEMLHGRHCVKCQDCFQRNR
jgi:hypothetical protein